MTAPHAQPTRRKLIAANWKLNGSLAANQALLQPVAATLCAQPPACDVVVCVPAPYLAQACTFQGASRAEGASAALLQVGAQDVSEHASGAYTGEVSACMVRDLGAGWVIVGHSERRQYHHETDAVVAAKARAALAEGLTPIVCVGETLAEREAGDAEATVQRQLDTVLQTVGEAATRIVVAYEPVWAIGTGRSATPETAQAMHAALRIRVGAAAPQVRILYGGSMNAANASALLVQPDIDGGLIGSASLQAETFLAIIAAAAR